MSLSSWQNKQWQWLPGAAIIALTVLFCYRGILFPPSPDARYPWASDTLGHIVKAEYLHAQIAQGHVYPDIFPGWYLGVQMLRYYPPLPYYLLVGLSVVVGDSVAAANMFIVLCALAGGLTWLLYRRWIGWLPATVGGALYTFLPDNVRVALAEGNLPRVLATALLPLAVYFLLRTLDGERRPRMGLAACLATIVLTHAMMAAIYAACGALLALLWWACRATQVRHALLSVAAIVLGVLLSGWWLLPSLTGGITELDRQAMTEALAVFSLSTYLNPALRLTDPEIVYPGAALLLATTAALFIRRGRDGRSTALTLTGLFGVLISTPGFNALFNALPMHNLFWPLRFIGFATFALLLALMWRLREWARASPLWPTLLLALLVADGALSLSLIHLRPLHPDIAAVAGRLADLPGWREATFDYSRLGSAPSYFFTAVGGREQVYGWAYQGARTARNVAALNDALRRGYVGYVMDRLTLFGTDDVLLLHAAPIASDLPTALGEAGFAPVYRGQETTLYHRDGTPRAYRATWPALGIGRGAQNLSFILPQMIVGSSRLVDDYELEELTSYEALFLSGFGWRDRRRAEELVEKAAQAGVRVLVDLTGAPDDPMAREPHFLGVWGEKIALGRGPLRITGEGKSLTLAPFDAQFPLWQAHTPQGLEVETWHHEYLGAQSAVLGYNTYGRGKVWFIGLNLPYHAFLTRDPVAVELLTGVLGLPAYQANDYQQVPLDGYQATQDGYRFAYTLAESATLLVPVAHHDGSRVYVDGRPTPSRSLERLVAFDAPAGRHAVEILVRMTPIYLWGWAVSLLAGMGMVILYRLQTGGKGEGDAQTQAVQSAPGGDTASLAAVPGNGSHTGGGRPVRRLGGSAEHK